MNSDTFPTPLTISAAECLPPDKARLLVEVVRLLGQRAGRESIEIRDDDGTVLGFLVVPASYSPLPSDMESPEFLAEMERRLRNPEPAVPVEEVFKLLDELCGPADPIEPG